MKWVSTAELQVGFWGQLLSVGVSCSRRKSLERGGSMATQIELDRPVLMFLHFVGELVGCYLNRSRICVES